MRKYALPKALYVILISLLLCLSINSTYAYFSASNLIESDITLHTIDVTWRDENSNMALFTTLFDDPSTAELNEAMSIQIISELRRGDYVQLQAEDINGTERNIKLNISNIGTTGAYCRMKITGKYTTKDGQEKTCKNGWLKLALANGNNKKFITETGWFYNDSNPQDNEDGYYYYGVDINNLSELTKHSGLTVADYIYLSADSSSDIYGSSLTITLTLETVQSTYNVYKDVWGL